MDTPTDPMLVDHYVDTRVALEWAGLTRVEAEVEAARSTGVLARNRAARWPELRAALAECDWAIAELPDIDAVVDWLPLGLPSRQLIRASGEVRRQGVWDEGYFPRRRIG